MVPKLKTFSQTRQTRSSFGWPPAVTAQGTQGTQGKRGLGQAGSFSAQTEPLAVRRARPPRPQCNGHLKPTAETTVQSVLTLPVLPLTFPGAR
ncbi:hypothetical protein GGTG_11960 [Gaeumannomyces tritici R3-111a-1]|uniref:Uncharacterized protein n=1 Tax=Gaeumannomyces tritici (strain R3-111a-1) TaxID=644352 RepID=J3PEM9_GAET3|nr:hypothetical protein GGTG_11960 [Gaeumannomyces tritici R3-111a-1]EJT70937.1 hypothetical protein GGTG_11960 [Gaeumannomyces tritici R3-111a-1]